MRHLRGVSTLRIDPDKCTGCGMCLQVCPHAVIARDGRKVRAQDLDACMECGACAKNCPAEAIYVRAGVGCAYAIINGMIRGGPPDCGCGEGEGATCCS
ncbi:MAG: mercury methylation ferredoxin HgcB [Elusimicrobiota bacterium]